MLRDTDRAVSMCRSHLGRVQAPFLYCFSFWVPPGSIFLLFFSSAASRLNSSYCFSLWVPPGFVLLLFFPLGASRVDFPIVFLFGGFQTSFSYCISLWVPPGSILFVLFFVLPGSIFVIAFLFGHTVGGTQSGWGHTVGMLKVLELWIPGVGWKQPKGPQDTQRVRKPLKFARHTRRVARHTRTHTHTQTGSDEEEPKKRTAFSIDANSR